MTRKLLRIRFALLAFLLLAPWPLAYAYDNDVAEPPLPPPGTIIVGSAHKFEPDGATIDLAARTIAVPVAHFTTFAVLYRQPSSLKLGTLTISSNEVTAGSGDGTTR